MKKRHVAPARAPDVDAVEYEPILSREEIETRRQSRLHLSWRDQIRLLEKDLEPPAYIKKLDADWTAFYDDVQEQMLKLFQAYGIDLSANQSPTIEQWQNLALLQAIRSREINVIVDGAPLPVRAGHEDISLASSILLATGTKHAAERHEHIRLIFLEMLESCRSSKNGKTNKSEAARRTVDELKLHYPGEYKDSDWNSILKNHGRSLNDKFPVRDATVAYFHKVMAVYRGIETIAMNLTGKSRLR